MNTNIIEEEITDLRAKASRLEGLLVEFTDLKEQKLRWRTVLTSKKVNENPEKTYTSHSCGCCNDAGLQAWFYVERDGHKIFSDPPYVYVGEKNPCYGEYEGEERDNWDSGWEEFVHKYIGNKAASLLKKYRGQDEHN